ncbi:MAG: glycoside hydrolase family 97 C-terminal domain-containing protein [Kiritimatiellae bacterium]|nr:glycoside hydrolase family 97 C-terminal domain-containing protein [Kiritimatiellia bacterium]
MITVESPDKVVSASLALETFWIDDTAYPGVPVLRVDHRRGPVIQRSRLAFQPACGEPMRNGLRLVSVKQQRPITRLGAGRQVVVRLQESGALERELEITVRLTGISAFCGLRLLRDRRGGGQDISELRLADGTSLHSHAGDSPVVAYSPGAVLLACWQHAAEHHLLMLERPGALVEMRFNVLVGGDEIPVETGADGCRSLFTQLPFFAAAMPPVRYGVAVRESFKLAFNCILSHFTGSASDDDFWVIRGEPGEFAVVARRIGATWLVSGICAAAKTLTLRFEDLWLRMPAAYRALLWRVRIVRDPVNAEPGESVAESFGNLAPDIKIALDVKKNGGFWLEFKPHEKKHG